MSFVMVTLCILPLPFGNSNSFLPASLALSAANTKAFDSSMSESSSIYPCPHSSQEPSSSSSCFQDSSTLCTLPLNLNSFKPFSLADKMASAMLDTLIFFIFVVSLFSSNSSPIWSNLSIISVGELYFTFSIMNSFLGCFFL